MSDIKILALSGSLRGASYNKKLVKIALTGAEAAGATGTLVELNDYPMPFMNEDLEAAEGVPERAQALKTLLKSHQGFLIASPEYNGSFSGVLKNTIDWCSRQEEGEAVLECFRDKVVAIMAASPGNLGGMRGLIQLRTLLSGIGCLVLPSQVAVSNASEAFNQDGLLNRPKQQQNVEKLGHNLVTMCSNLQSTQ